MKKPRPDDLITMTIGEWNEVYDSAVQAMDACNQNAEVIRKLTLQLKMAYDRCPEHLRPYVFANQTASTLNETSFTPN